MKAQSQISDRISALPEDIIGKILSHILMRYAVRTSILSKKWRYYWTRIPKLDFHANMVVSTGNKEVDKYKLVSAIFHVLLLHKGPILEFSLFVSAQICSEVDQIILQLSKSNKMKKFYFGIVGTDHSYLLPSSFFSLQGLEHLDLTHCVFDRALTNKGFSMLRSLRFFEVDISHKTLQGFLTNCPLLEEFAWIRDNLMGIELTECEFVELFKCLPSVQVLELSKWYIQHLDAGGIPPHKLPISLPYLRILDLDVCFLELSSVLRVINSSPNLEKIKVEMCWDSDDQYPSNNLPDIQEYSDVNLDHLKELEITSFHNLPPEMEFVKIIMGKSPVLKKARIELNSHVSVDEEVEMLRDLVHMPIPRASPAVRFTIERPKY